LKLKGKTRKEKSKKKTSLRRVNEKAGGRFLKAKEQRTKPTEETKSKEREKQEVYKSRRCKKRRNGKKKEETKVER